MIAVSRYVRYGPAGVGRSGFVRRRPAGHPRRRRFDSNDDGVATATVARTTSNTIGRDGYASSRPTVRSDTQSTGNHRPVAIAITADRLRPLPAGLGRESHIPIPFAECVIKGPLLGTVVRPVSIVGKCGGVQARWTKRTLTKLPRWLRPTSICFNVNSQKLDKLQQIGFLGNCTRSLAPL